jgi:D-3-phosphoglycerate dehydrogenase
LSVDPLARRSSLGRLFGHEVQLTARFGAQYVVMKLPARPRILLLNGTCLDVLQENQDWIRKLDAEIVAEDSFRHLEEQRLSELMREADGVIGPLGVKLSDAHFANAPRVRVVSLASSGFDSVDLDAASRSRVVVTNAPAPELSEVVADLAWGLIIAIGRQILQHDRKIREGNLQRGMGTSPWRKTLGIVGLGMIGKAVARRAVGFEMNILATEPFPDSDFVNAHHIELVELDELLARADFVTLHIRLNEETRDMIRGPQLARMKSTGFLINTARRELIHEEDLADALAAGKLAGAALDDPPSTQQSRLLVFPNVIFTTHIGNRATAGVNAVFRLAVENAVEVLQGRRPRHVLNPQVLEAATN